MSTEIPFLLADGVDTYSPALTSAELRFLRLKNLQPYMSRLFAARGHLLHQTGSDATSTIHSLGAYTDPTTLLTSLYAFDQTSIYRYNFTTNLFDFASPIFSSFVDSELPYGVARWYSSLFATKPGLGNEIVKIEGNTVTPVTGAPAARYLIVANSHLMAANISGSSDSPLRFQWSDLYDAEGWVPGIGSEADYYELEPNEGEVTGLSYQRGSVLGYTRESVWIARYNPSQSTFNFEVLYSGVGCAAHYGQVRVKEIDFFVGSDNFYAIDGLQLRAIGDKIWDFYKSTIDVSTQYSEVRAFYDQTLHEVSWVYTHKDGGFWSVVYNFKEDKWSDRDPQNVRSILNVNFAITGNLVIDEISTPVDDVSDTIDGAWQTIPVDAKNFYGSTGQRIFKQSFIKYDKADSTQFEYELETYEMDFNKLRDSKELDILVLLFSSLGAPDISLYVGTRISQRDDVTWSPAIALSDMLVTEPTFFFREHGVGRFIRFKLTWTNSVSNAVKELYKLSFKHIANEDVDIE